MANAFSESTIELVGKICDIRNKQKELQERKKLYEYKLEMIARATSNLLQQESQLNSELTEPSPKNYSEIKSHSDLSLPITPIDTIKATPKIAQSRLSGGLSVRRKRQV